MDTNQVVEAVNSLNATVRRLIFAFECDRGLELGRNGYYKKDEVRNTYYAECPEEHQDPYEEFVERMVTSTLSKAERKAFFQKQIEMLEEEGN
jgi:hypothetical protein